MHAYLISGYNQEKIEDEVRKLTKKLGARLLPFELAKISDVREMANFTKLTLSEKTAILIPNFEQATEEAQNAFLKALEEPQENLFFILTAKNQDLVLPTVVSRCATIEITSPQTQAGEKTVTKTQEFIKMDTGEQLLTISKINKREDAKEFLSNLISGGHELFKKDPTWANFLDQASQTLLALEANGNVQLQLTNFILQTTSEPAS